MLGTLGLIVLLIGTVSGVIASPPSQEPDEIEAIALRIHLHNTRSTDFTVWPGGDLGTNIGVKPTWSLGTPLEDWEFPGLGDGQESLRLDDLHPPHPDQHLGVVVPALHAQEIPAADADRADPGRVQL